MGNSDARRAAQRRGAVVGPVGRGVGFVRAIAGPIACGCQQSGAHIVEQRVRPCSDLVVRVPDRGQRATCDDSTRLGGGGLRRRLMIVVGLSRTMTMDLAPVVVVSLMGDVGMHVDKRRRCRSNGERQAEQPDKQTETPVLHRMPHCVARGQTRQGIYADTDFRIASAVRSMSFSVVE